VVFADKLRVETLAQGDILEEVEFYAPRNGGYRDTNRLPGIITRVASMTDEAQQQLQRSLDRFFSWEDRKKPLEAQ
jgi:hypothetical protein